MGTRDALTTRLQAQSTAMLMGIVNVTPDSFYDGGRYLSEATARDRVDELVAHGAEIIDIGAESSRPGSVPVPAAEQIARMEPVVQHAVRLGNPLVSIDTASAAVADRMLELGAHIVNDVSCLGEIGLAEAAARHEAILILMHSRGPMPHPSGFSKYPDSGYGDVVTDVRHEWGQARDRAIAVGVPRHRIFFDPGIGFSKNARHSFEILARLHEFQTEQAPIVIGPSRKSFIASVDDAPAEARLGGTIAACLLGVQRGARILRVHDVREVAQALKVHQAVTTHSSIQEAAHA